MMRYNPIAQTGLRASAVGFGTCQLRLVPEQQAVDTLKRGFELGVNLVHTSPDYEGADKLAAQAVAESGRDVMVMSQGYGDMDHFEYLFERASRTFRKKRLELFGISCIDDREYLGEDVWGPQGMVQFLLRKKKEGRLSGIYCTTHGEPEYVARLICSGCFDAIMVAYNILGFHLLSYRPEPPKGFEDIPQNGESIFPLAARCGVGLFIMKPLAGGLLCEGKAFPPYHWFAPEASKTLSATDVLRWILMRPEVCSVIPGTASVKEAEENALAGYPPYEFAAGQLCNMESTVVQMKAALCSRCGHCDPLCSKSLPISWLFRDAYICHYPSETFETLDRLQYFALHPWDTAACASCDRITCYCPHGMDIPKELIRLHDRMLRLKNQGLLPVTPAIRADARIDGPFSVEVIRHHVPTEIHAGRNGMCRFYLENAGSRTWKASCPDRTQEALIMGVFVGKHLIKRVPLRQDVVPGNRAHFCFLVTAPWRTGEYSLSFTLQSATGKARLKGGTLVFRSTLSVVSSRNSDPLRHVSAALERALQLIWEKILGSRHNLG